MDIRKGKLSMKNIDSEAERKAVARKTAQKRVHDAHTIHAEDWARIHAMKNSTADADRLKRLQRAVESGVISRNPADAVSKTGTVKAFSKAEALRLFADLLEIERESTLRKMVETKPDNYVMIDSYEELAAMVDRVFETTDIIAIDTETTGLDNLVDVIVGFSITNPADDIHYYVPIKPTDDSRALGSVRALEIVKPLVESNDIRKVLHNAAFDIKMFRRHNIEMGGLYWDTMPGMVMLNENEPSYALKNLATKYLKEPADTFAELFGKNAKFAEIPLDIATVYAAKDTHVTWDMYEFQRKHLERMPSVLNYFLTVEMPLISAVVDMEETGFVIDEKYTREYGRKMVREIEALRGYLVDELTPIGADEPINLNSPAQLKPALEAVTGEKLESTDAKKVLKPLSKRHPIVARLLEYKKLSKLYGTYISVLPEKIHPKTGRVYVRFNPNGTVTGRFSSGGGGTNIQNQPKDARPMYVAPPGWVIVGADFKSQEIRCAANKSGEPVLLDAFNRKIDPYAFLASKHYVKPYSECHKLPDDSDTPERKTMKVVMLAVMYGMGPGALATSLKISMDEAKQFLKDFFETYPAIKQWIDRTQTYAKKNGFVWIGEGKRKRRLPDAKRKTRGQYVPEVSRALRQGPNAEIQGESAIQTKTTLIRLHAVCKRMGWKLWATVHDEILVLMPEDATMDDIREFERVMIESYAFGEVPNGTDIEMGTRWGELVPPSVWFKSE